ncbi:ribonuclease M5 [Paenisporosarcina quisquiliarum]|uniref:Ribonuclease M5 n=1 Tax=Psychrobacillus psychrodurans TaxID=126157 RepID=A0A9X3LDQ3_9BACI|nr:ribonuclease M5 [Psychrobacillus psychrodurans]SEN94924.1 ribonuclease M5 [Paenisporosarcina quisquiliarum]MCK1999546.1 ribonuclease M5 [Psychrobacillus psychrodurans]MCZ8535369.1 ribonuclease M5 [Psychrobacillus psychrodurans]MCZ8542062.1 ribonuclease M5 [Psychrobacillus psychrodurans]SFN15820.1 ribonuclease M5 [Psychrobacillus psychrodurans]
MQIKEIIVVEGKDDTTAIKRSVEADTIETNGSAISKETLIKIQHAQDKRGVIVFTDPDYPGRRIRAIIEEQVPGVKHAFLSKEKTIAKNGKGLGIEHAKDEDIRAALSNVYTPKSDKETFIEIPLSILVDGQLIGHPHSKERRTRLGELLKIGYTNGKQLQKRLSIFQISQQQVEEAIAQLNLEENNICKKI